MVHMLGTWSSYVGFHCLREDLSFPFMFKRKQFPVHLNFTMTINKAHGHYQLLVYIYWNQCFHMGNYMLLYQGVCLKDPPRFYVSPVKKLISKAIALRILCILTSLELGCILYYFSYIIYQSFGHF
jgi:hypothetical protein